MSLKTIYIICLVMTCVVAFLTLSDVLDKDARVLCAGITGFMLFKLRDLTEVVMAASLIETSKKEYKEEDE